MRIAILYNPRLPHDARVPDDASEEYDDPGTVAAIAQALAALGMEPVPVCADAEFPRRLAQGRFGLVFNIAEGAGRRCREAVPAAICEFLGLPFTGSDALTLALTLDKAMARRVVAPDVSVPPAVLVEGPDDEARLPLLRYPVIAKPNDEGSSKGIGRDSVCADAGAARARSRWLRERYACPVLVEQFLPGAEVTVGVRGNGRAAVPIGLMEVAPSHDDGKPFVYGLEAKRDFRRQVRYHVPPRVPAAQLEAIGAMALAAYRLLGCRDVARLDFRLDADARPHFIECNPLPGLNPESSDLVILSRAVAPDDARAYERLVQGIARDAIRRCGLSMPSPA
jgi:D-alanine-D-alanine ligase